ncbi:iron donor protein CyaY [Kangiella sp. TOML190]|uniref:iron donor protein CyaY n=1 Tax=Kangiella sp. TOML190 TaxID=2931351 RepID=UPI00203BF8B9|nr:iron donor protein CyaY [Kangiella sp. TOML190]
MNSHEYHQKIEATLLAIEEAMETMIQETDMDIDYETGGGILTISLGAGGKLILNQQAPLQQLWLAAKSGGYHLDWNPAINQWQTDRDGEPLDILFNRVFTEQTGVEAHIVIEI